MLGRNVAKIANAIFYEHQLFVNELFLLHFMGMHFIASTAEKNIYKQLRTRAGKNKTINWAWEAKCVHPLERGIASQKHFLKWFSFNRNFFSSIVHSAGICVCSSIFYSLLAWKNLAAITIRANRQNFSLNFNTDHRIALVFFRRSYSNKNVYMYTPTNNT